MRSIADYDRMKEEFSFVPEHMREGYKLWIERGISPGSFGWALITNDLKEVFGRADHVNKQHIGSTIVWFYNFAPSGCWGSIEKAMSWKERFVEKDKSS